MDRNAIGLRFLSFVETVLSYKQKQEIQLVINELFLSLERPLIITNKNISLENFAKSFDSGYLLVSNLNNTSGYISQVSNLRLRAIHDFHHLQQNTSTTVIDECKLGIYDWQKGDLFNRFYRSDVLYQACYFEVNNNFMPSQKLVLQDLI